MPSPRPNSPERWPETYPPWLYAVEPWSDVQPPWLAPASSVHEPAAFSNATGRPAMAPSPSPAPHRPWTDLVSSLLNAPEPSDTPTADIPLADIPLADDMGPLAELAPIEATLAEPDGESAESW